MNKIKALGLSISLIGLLNAGCSKTVEEKIVSEGTINGNKVKVIEEVTPWNPHMYRLEVYDNNGSIRIRMRSSGADFPQLTIGYDSGIKHFERYSRPK